VKKIILLVAAMFSGALWGADVTGKWSGSLKDDAGHSFPWYLNLQQDGTKISGKMGPEKDSDQRPIVDGGIEGTTLHFRAPGGDGSGTEFVTVELHLGGDGLTGTLEGKDRTGKVQKYTLSLMREVGQ